MRAVRCWSFCLSLFLLAGCAGYQLGPTNGLMAGSKSIQIAPFENQTNEPRLTEAVATAMRRRLQQDGTFRLATRESGDIVVRGVITRYERTALSFDPKDILTARDFSIVMFAKVTAVDQSSGMPVLDREVSGRTTVRSGTDQASAERQAVPLLADDLARMVTALLVDGNW
ncbi:MAG: LPS assembly lipoprotein LptE [Verrucomicrobiota bacterium]